MKWQFALGLLLCVALAVYASPADQNDDDEAVAAALADMAEPAQADEEEAPEAKFRVRFRRRYRLFRRRLIRRYYRRFYLVVIGKVDPESPKHLADLRSRDRRDGPEVSEKPCRPEPSREPLPELSLPEPEHLN